MPSERTPKYRHHRPSDQAVVTLNGRDFYLGPYKSRASRLEYDRLIAEWLANGRRQPGESGTANDRFTIMEIVDAFLTHAEGYYRKPDGTPTSEYDNCRQAVAPLIRLYGRKPAVEFGPLALKAVRQEMLDRGWCRKHINSQIARVRMVFRWATAQEMTPVTIYQALQTVPGLKQGRTDARESEPVRPVPMNLVDAIQPHVSNQVWAMIQMQLLTAARPGEVVTMRPGDIDRSGPIWACTPTAHKTAHHGHRRTIYIGPKAQQTLAPFLLRAPGTFCFSPTEAEAARHASIHMARQTPLSYGNSPGTNRKASPARTPGICYDVAAYRRAIERGCDLAFPPPENLRRGKIKGKKGMRWETRAEWRARLGRVLWAELETWQKAHRWHPHQLRHNAATAIRKQFNLEAARAVLGHHSAAVTEIYAEMDSALAASVISKVG